MPVKDNEGEILRNSIYHAIVQHKSEGYITSDVLTPMFSSTDVEEIVNDIMGCFAAQRLQAVEEFSQKLKAHMSFQSDEVGRVSDQIAVYIDTALSDYQRKVK